MQKVTTPQSLIADQKLELLAKLDILKDELKWHT